MNLINAINLLAPFHICAITCIVRKDNGKFDAQLSTGQPDCPFIPISDSMVLPSDVLEILDMYENQSIEPTQPIQLHQLFQEEPNYSFNLGTSSDIWGLCPN